MIETFAVTPADKQTFAEYVEYLESGLNASWMKSESDEAKENFLMEEIDKSWRRGIINETVAFALMHHFDLCE